MRLPRLAPLAPVGPLVLLAVLVSGFGTTTTRALADEQPKPAPCVKYWGEVRSLAYGFNHVVHLQSTCKKTAVCAVSSDVSPDVQTVSLAVGASTEVLTFMGSPASTFVPKVSCTPP